MYKTDEVTISWLVKCVYWLGRSQPGIAEDSKQKPDGYKMRLAFFAYEL
jgi:hypothetical protein